MFLHSNPRYSVQGTPLFQLPLLLFLLSPWESIQSAIPNQQDHLLKFTAAGHVLGFQPDGFYVASGEHMLHVGFIGTDGMVPEATGAEANGSK